jgi:5-methyltetrahydropteroyltriglutamate--homocysteine methyltransferase
MTILAETLGYSRIGKNREIKKALEAFSSGKLETNALLQTVATLRNLVKYAKWLREEANAS